MLGDKVTSVKRKQLVHGLATMATAGKDATVCFSLSGQNLEFSNFNSQSHSYSYCELTNYILIILISLSVKIINEMVGISI